MRISKDPERCPDASKLGTVEVESPLLAQIDEEDNVVYDPQGDPVPRPVHGDLFPDLLDGEGSQKAGAWIVRVGEGTVAPVRYLPRPR